MKFVSIDEEIKRVAHTSGVIEMIGKDPVDLPVYDEEKGTGYKGLMECAMLAGCVPFNGKGAVVANKDISKAEMAKIEAGQAILDKGAADLAEEKAQFEKEKAEYFASLTAAAPAAAPAAAAPKPTDGAAKTATDKGNKAAVILE